MDNLVNQAQELIASGKAQQFLASEKGQALTSKYGDQFKSYTGVDIKTVEGFLGVNPNQQNQQQNQQEQQGNNNQQPLSSTNQDNNHTPDSTMSSNNNQSPQVSEGQFGQKGQYGAVTGQGFGGGLAKDSQGQPLNSTQEKNQESNYSGYGQNDSSASGGFGRNAQGSAYSRAMGGADSSANYGGSDDADQDGTKTGASTPGYRKDGDDGHDQQFRGQNLGMSSNNKDDEEPNI